MSSVPPLDSNVKDWLQGLAWLAVAIGAVLAMAKFWFEMSQNREQRARELRWKQAEAGKRLNDDLLADKPASDARHMLDYASRAFVLPSSTRTTITHDDLLVALDPRAEVVEEKHLYIRDCFDSLFYYMAIFEHYIGSTLTLTEDVAFPLEYYVPLLARFRSVVQPYLDAFGLTRTQAFLSRYSTWRNAPVGVAAATQGSGAA